MKYLAPAFGSQPLPWPAGTPIRWQCGSCDDHGLISNWEDTAFDLRRRHLILSGPVTENTLPNEVAVVAQPNRSQTVCRLGPPSTSGDLPGHQDTRGAPMFLA